ncbi:aldose 1-epimerase family protein [Nocardioides salsibiostraticola]
MLSHGLSPSGIQFEIVHGGYRAVVTEGGAALRHLSHSGRDLIDGFGEADQASGGRGQILMPWPNRIRDGRYSVGGVSHQLALTEPKRSNASHGLVRWVAWTPGEHTASSVTLSHRLMAQSGYPWVLDLVLTYRLDDDGLHVTQSATNRSDSPAPFASGAHPYLTAGPGPVDTWELTLPAATRSLVDERLLPVGSEPVEGTAYDFRVPRILGSTELNDAVTDLTRTEQGVAVTSLVDPATGDGVSLWVDEHHRWLQVYTADDVPATARRSMAVEPMTVNADAFNSGQDLVLIEPDTTFAARWGIVAI